MKVYLVTMQLELLELGFNLNNDIYQHSEIKCNDISLESDGSICEYKNGGIIKSHDTLKIYLKEYPIIYETYVFNKMKSLNLVNIIK